MAHHCHAASCLVPVPEEMFMCKRHWFMLPYTMRQEIWRTYRDGQCDDWQITHEYAEAAIKAVRKIAQKEGRTEAEVEQAIRVYKILDPER